MGGNQNIGVCGPSNQSTAYVYAVHCRIDAFLYQTRLHLTILASRLHLNSKIVRARSTVDPCRSLKITFNMTRKILWISNRCLI